MIEIRLVVAITGASGVEYGIKLMEVLNEIKDVEVFLVITEAGEEIIEIETDYSLKELKELSDKFFGEKEMDASIASGSFLTDGMVIVPASQKTIGAISSGYANNLVIRAADVCLKEGRELVVVPREAPVSDIHLSNMLDLSKAGAKVLPASPGFYHNPSEIEDLFDFIVGRILDQFEVKHDLFDRWR